MSAPFIWYVARASGFVAWGLVVASILWGLVMATRVLGRRPHPAWLLNMHKFLGVLTMVFVGVHVAAILLDDFVHFSLADVLVPFASSWHPVAVAWGVAGMYLLLAIQVTSWLRKYLAPTVWHAVHLTSYLLLALTTIHLLTAGTDVRSLLSTALAVAVGVAIVMGAGLVWTLRADVAADDRFERRTRRAQREASRLAAGSRDQERRVPAG